MTSEYRAMKKQLVEQNKELLSANARIKTLEEKFDSLGQEIREKNIVLMNDPAQNQGNSKELVTNIFNGLGVEISDIDFESARITNNINAPILIKLRKIEKEIGCLKMRHCGLAGDSVIYFIEDITHYKQMLHSKARQLKKENRFKYAWVKDGNVYLRKNDDARQIQ
ncbi:hypothetical protein HHI36_001518 [Cryptolaemus montrouzieri]|uniref:FP protein C-terminal domain-containing protein n=1 Tax=Cryptolaemus montrouzieri TaxID=559131 RepID=A0ABD2P7P3_9CUCU